MGADYTNRQLVRGVHRSADRHLRRPGEPLPTADAASIQEVQSYLTYWTGAYDCLFFCMNAELYNSLSPELQAIVDEAGQAACEYERELNRSQDQEIMDKWAEAGVEITELTPELLLSSLRLLPRVRRVRRRADPRADRGFHQRHSG